MVNETMGWEGLYYKLLVCAGLRAGFNTFDSEVLLGVSNGYKY